MARKNCSRNPSKFPWSNWLTASTYCTSACACFNAFSMAGRLLNLWAKLTISGRTNISPRVICFFSWMPSREVQRLKATYACPPANTPPVKSTTTRLKVRPWLLCMVIAHARRMGYWMNTPNSSSSIFFSLSL